MFRLAMASGEVNISLCCLPNQC